MRSLLAIICLIFSINSYALELRDSVGVENNNGNQMILHKVAAKENYYSIARLYHVLPKDIIEVNGNKTLQIGSILKVPTNRPFAKSASLANPPTATTAESQNADIVTYKVGPKETLFAIARRFNTNIEDIKELNNLKSNSLSVGQLLKVRQGSGAVSAPEKAKPEPVVVKQESKPATEGIVEEKDQEPADVKPKASAGRLGLTEKTEKGVAVWIADENLDSSKMLALHRSAPIGTIVKITNPMTDRTTFAKVVGKFTENATTKDVIIVVTKATADTIGALDKRFQVTIDYGVPNE